MDQKDNFLISEFLISSLNAAFQLNQVYKKDINEDKRKKEFRNYIKKQLSIPEWELNIFERNRELR